MKILLRAVLTLVFTFCAKGVFAQVPVANFTAKYTSGCVPLCDSFFNTSTGSPTSYLWNFGNGVTSTLQNPSVCYAIAGTYIVTLTASNANGSSTKTMTVTVHPGPTVSFTTSPTAGCPPVLINFTNATTSSVPGPITYSWQYGDGSPLGSGTNSSHVYTSPGQRNVTLTATDAQGCVKSLVVPVMIHTPPIINFTAQNNQCDAPATVNFTANITGTAPYSYQWDFGNGATANTASPTVIYANPGVYTVSLVVTDANGCKDTLVKNNYMNIGNLVPNFTSTAACQGTPTQFTNTSNLVDSVKWKFGDGGTDTANNPAHIYSASGVFNVTMYAYYKTCIDSVIKQVTVHPKPNAAYTFTPPHPCPPPSTVTFINQSTGAVSYVWDFGDGATSTQANPVHTYTYDTAFFPKLIAISNQGCPDTSYLEDTVVNYIGILGLQSAQQYQCLGDTTGFTFNIRTVDYFDPMGSFMPYPFPITGYVWHFGDGASSTVASPSHVYTARGIYKASLTVTTSNGCTFTDTINILVGQKPTASFTFSPDTVCNRGTITVNNTTINATYYMWDMGNTNAWSDTVLGTFTFKYTQSGIDTIILYAFDYGCADTFYATKPIVVHPPTSLWDVRYFCDSPLKVQLFDTLSLDPTSHWWSFGDGDSTTLTNPVHTYPALGNYSVTLYTHNSIYGCYDTLTKGISLLSPTLTFSTPDTAICEGDSLVFTPSYTVTPGQEFNWYVDAIAYYPLMHIPVRNPNRTSGAWGYRFKQRGVYTIILLAEDIHGCVDTFRKTILVGMPEAGFFATPELACNPATITFTDTSTDIPPAFQTTRQWDFGNGNTTTVNGATASNTYTAAGLYTVRMIVTDNIGCIDTIVKTNYIDIRDPLPGFHASDSNVCMKELIAFTNTTTGSAKYTSFWDFGDGTTDTARNPVKSYQQTGSFTVKLVITDSIGCKDSITKVGYININHPNAQFLASDTLSICPPLNVIFTNTSQGALTYAWDLGNGTNTTLQNPTGSYTTPGIYQVRLIALNAENCRDTAYGKITVLGYSGLLTYSPLKGCAPLQVNFKSQLYNIPNVIWDFSDGVTQPANGIDTTIHIYTTPGSYVPKLILSDNSGCQNSSLGLDTIKVDGIRAGFITSSPCVNTPVSFVDTTFSYFSPVTAWWWSLNNGQVNSTLSQPSFVFPAGTYPVMLVVTNANGCKDSLSGNFTIHDLPKIVAVSDTVICNGDAATLSATGGLSYVWTPAATLSCSNCQSPIATPTVPTSYLVTGTDANGCSNRDTVSVSLQSATTSTVAPGGAICTDSIFQLQVSGAHRYQWSPAPTLSDSTIANPIARPLATTEYMVIAWEGSCAPDTNKVRVIVYPAPDVDAGTDETIVAGSSVMLTARGTNIDRYAWSPAQTLSCDICSNPTASPMVTTQYRVVVQSPFGCRASDSVVVKVLCHASQVYIPNTFSPNGDGQNDVFFPRGAGLQVINSFRVYNRWGELVFERRGIQLNDRANGWDGYFRGNEASPDVFVYVVDALCDNGEPISWKGDVTLLR